jgi:hypothetical protein
MASYLCHDACYDNPQQQICYVYFETVLVEKVIDAVREDVHVLIMQDNVPSIQNVVNVL